MVSWMLNIFDAVISFQTPISFVLSQLPGLETLVFHFSKWKAHVSDGLFGYFYYEYGFQNVDWYRF